MRIFGRNCTSSELMLFGVAYLLGNFVIFKMQQRWADQELQESEKVAHLAHIQSLKDRAHARTVHLPLNNAHFIDRHDPKPPEGSNAYHLIPERIPLDQSDDYSLEAERHARLLTKVPVDNQVDPESYPTDDELSEEAERKEREELKRERLGDPTKEGYKLILFWNKFFNSDDFRFGIGHQPFIEHKCPVHQCITTVDKRKVDQADLVMFHGPRIDRFPPPRRPKNQVYAYVQQEPHYSMSAEEIPKYNGYMNLTITHRRDGDIWIPYARVGFDPAKAHQKPKHIRPKDKPRSVAWVVSHCSTPGKREWYVQELQKYIDIDIYGDCGDMQCSKDDTWYCYEKFAREYRFYMALENNFCSEYISEKAFRPLAYDIVPIVFGGANYTELTPPHSVINIMDYPHPRDLAKHLHYLAGNEKAYNKYFAWKSKGYELESSRKNIMGEAFCKVCEILHDPEYRYREYRNLKSWWTNNACDTFTIPRMRRKSKW